MTVVGGGKEEHPAAGRREQDAVGSRGDKYWLEDCFLGTRPGGEKAMNAIAGEVTRRATRALEAVPARLRSSIYVVSLYVEDWEDDPALPTVQIGFNTEDQVAETTGRADDEDEARWNFAFWLQNTLDAIGGPEDPEGSRVIDEAFALADLSYDPDDFSDAARAVGRAMTELFVDSCVDAARHLHDGGVITSVFGRSIPVLVHELEYYDVIAEQNRRSNPPGVADEFCGWIDAMYER